MSSCIDRRRFLTLCATSAVASQLVAACDDEEPDPDGEDVPWATGGTKSMTRQDDYPDPFDLPGTMCLVACDLERGPCYSNQAEMIRDISYGKDGLPMRMCYRFLGPDCEPLQGLEVIVWHADIVGIYSGSDSEHMEVDFCTDGRAEYRNSLYFRGRQITDEAGVVCFDTCFPSFYGLRTTHIHMIVRVAGELYYTLEFCVPDALVDELSRVHPLYIPRGRPGQTNANDVVFSQTGDFRDYELEVAKMPDGAVLAWKTMILRDAADAACKYGGGPWDDQST